MNRMFGWIILAASLLFLGIASYTDFRSREVADEISVGFLAAALAIRLVWYLVSGEPEVFLIPLLVSFCFLAAGTAMYFLRQWGGGDVLMFAALGAAFGTLPPELGQAQILPFWLTLISNIAIAGTLYGSVWILNLLFSNRQALRKFYSSFGGRYWLFSVLAGAISVISVFQHEIQLKILGGLIFPLYCLLIASKSIESVCFVKKVKIKDLRVEDWIYEDIKSNGKIIISKKTPGLTKEDIARIKRIFSAGKLDSSEITVKEGIPFVPVFLLALILSILVGNPLLLLIPALPKF